MKNETIYYCAKNFTKTITLQFAKSLQPPDAATTCYFADKSVEMIF